MGTEIQAINYGSLRIQAVHDEADGRTVEITHPRKGWKLRIVPAPENDTYGRRDVIELRNADWTVDVYELDRAGFPGDDTGRKLR